MKLTTIAALALAAILFTGAALFIEEKTKNLKSEQCYFLRQEFVPLVIPEQPFVSVLNTCEDNKQFTITYTDDKKNTQIYTSKCVTNQNLDVVPNCSYIKQIINYQVTSC